MNGLQDGIRGSGTAVPGLADLSLPSVRQPRVSRVLWAAVDASLIGTFLLVLFIGFGLVGNRWYNIIGIESGSMAPTFAAGDLVVVLPPPARIETGMVLVMTVGTEHVTHRVVAVNGDGTFATRGDANTVNDAWVGREIKVDGLYVGTIPWLGNILPVRAASDASFADAATASMSITVGPWPPTPVPPTPPECAGMTFSQVIVGTAGDDVIDAGNGGDLVFGLGGNDTINGGNGKDCLVGSDGNDILIGGNGKDVLLGGAGDDTLYGGGRGVVIQGGNGNDLIDGGDGNDACYGTNKDTFVSCETGSTILGGTNPVVPLPTPTSGTQTVPPTSGASPSPDLGATPSLDPTASPSLDPGATPSPDPTASPSPVPDPTAASTGTPGPSPTPDPTALPTASPSPVPDPTAAATASPAPSALP
ncbi:MAG: signal peptidase I [Chloroflexota bacterium]